MKEGSPDLIAYHCIMHQTVSVTLSKHFAEVRNWKLSFNFSRSSLSLQQILKESVIISQNCRNRFRVRRVRVSCFCDHFINKMIEIVE